MVVVAVAMAVVETRRLRTALPLVVFASATLWLPNEPFVDAILGFQYASRLPGRSCSSCGDASMPLEVDRRRRDVLHLPVGDLPDGAARGDDAAGSSRSASSPASSTGCMEWPAIHWNVFEYYGDNPSRILGLPITSMVQNVLPLRVHGGRDPVRGAAPEGLARAAVPAGDPGLLPRRPRLLCTWPAYLALHAGWPTGVFLPLAIVRRRQRLHPAWRCSRSRREYHELRTGAPGRTASTAWPRDRLAGRGAVAPAAGRHRRPAAAHTLARPPRAPGDRAWPTCRRAWRRSRPRGCRRRSARRSAPSAVTPGVLGDQRARRARDRRRPVAAARRCSPSPRRRS